MQLAILVPNFCEMNNKKKRKEKKNCFLQIIIHYAVQDIFSRMYIYKCYSIRYIFDCYMKFQNILLTINSFYKKHNVASFVNNSS